MTIFKCPHCRAEYEILLTNVSFRHRSYAKCQQCWKTMYSWDSHRVPRFIELKDPAHTDTRRRQRNANLRGD
jgi:predicted Zn finger-like uncharacterized protein